MGLDKISPKLVKLATNIIDCHICNILNQSISSSTFPEQAKIANVRLINKKQKREEFKSYQPLLVLSFFSKIYEKLIQESRTPFECKFISEFISAYRKAYSTNYVLLKLIEQCKSALDNKNSVAAVLMQLSKAFDCIPHNLLIAKLHAYDVSENSLTFFYSYLKRRKQNVKINNTYSLFKELLSGVLQGSILAPIFSTFLLKICFFG